MMIPYLIGLVFAVAVVSPLWFIVNELLHGRGCRDFVAKMHADEQKAKQRRKS